MNYVSYFTKAIVFQLTSMKFVSATTQYGYIQLWGLFVFVQQFLPVMALFGDEKRFNNLVYSAPEVAVFKSKVGYNRNYLQYSS